MFTGVAFNVDLGCVALNVDCFAAVFTKVNTCFKKVILRVLKEVRCFCLKN